MLSCVYLIFRSKGYLLIILHFRVMMWCVYYIFQSYDVGSTKINMNDLSQTAIHFPLDKIALFKGNIYGSSHNQVHCYKCTG